jgi:hypothetical protein
MKQHFGDWRTIDNVQTQNNYAIFLFFLSMWLLWNHVHQYCDYLLAYFYQPWMIDGDDCGAISGMIEKQGKPMYSEETCPSAIWPT